MLQALLQGKLSRHQSNLEDILTSCVFGTFEFLEAHAELVRFLSTSVGGHAVQLAAVLLRSTRTHIKFWPWLSDGECSCEPDVLIDLWSDRERIGVVLVEAKYRSGKSSEAIDDKTLPPNDQLSREWLNVRHVAGELPAFVVYLTAHFVRPADEVTASEVELVNKGYAAVGTISWCSWRALPTVLASSSHRMLIKLRELIRDRYELAYFDGLSIDPPELDWEFQGLPALGFSISDWPRQQLPWLFDSTPNVTNVSWVFLRSLPWRLEE